MPSPILLWAATRPQNQPFVCPLCRNQAKVVRKNCLPIQIGDGEFQMMDGVDLHWPLSLSVGPPRYLASGPEEYFALTNSKNELIKYLI
ncbi:hypothetical protein GRI32_05420 [Altererythrobacter aestuarii]|uniref:Uncharacterized protein n=1 Tax=Alteraurantiacibacter aestuarii TaxID=650004 RepID=A0A844ZMV0_9SPHN|nr:hypothetical protein [Alteraurantiacibacter aestuarii]MXO88177.1 hypothetical protein [Alteraurantiacibacter aestuarii]